MPSPSRRASGLWLFLLFVLCGQAQAQNIAATGEPGVTAADNTNLTTMGPKEDSVLTAVRGSINDDNDLTTFTPTWQWSIADTSDGAYADISTATAATFTPLQEHVGKFVRACATFNDDDNNRETRCWTSVAAVVNVNDAPVASNNTIFVPVGGTYTFSAGDFPFTDEDGDALSQVIFGTVGAGSTTLSGSDVNPIGNASDGVLASGIVGYAPATGATTVMAPYTTFTFSVSAGGITGGDASANVTMTIDLVAATQAAATGAPTVTAASGSTAYNEDVELTASVTGVTDANGIVTHTRNWQWQSAAAQASTYTAIAGAAAAKFTPESEHVGRYIRVCLSFTDGIGTNEGPLCSVGTVIAATNDAPASGDSSVDVPLTATAADPYVFQASDFPFMDEEDGTTLHGVDIISAVATGKGTLRYTDMTGTLSGRDLEDGNLTAAKLSGLTYYPPATAVAGPNFATFTFRVSDADGGRSENHTMTINLISVDIRLRLRLFLEGPLR